jgi:hypothetical protein
LEPRLTIGGIDLGVSTEEGIKRSQLVELNVKVIGWLTEKAGHI